MRTGQAYQQKMEKFSVSEEKSLVRLTPDVITYFWQLFMLHFSVYPNLILNFKKLHSFPKSEQFFASQFHFGIEKLSLPSFAKYFLILQKKN